MGPRQARVAADRAAQVQLVGEVGEGFGEVELRDCARRP